MASPAKKKPDLSIIFGMGGPKKPPAGKGGGLDMPPLPDDEEESYDDTSDSAEESGESEDEKTSEDKGELDDDGKQLAAKALGSDDPDAAQALKDFVSHCMREYG
jgi:hypothetical protein